MTPSIKLTYFDAPVSRGEECRLALHLAGLDFEDDRIKFADWPALKPTTPFGAMPVLTLAGQALAQSNAILTLIGRRHGLHPKDDLEAARHEALMSHCEDLRANVGPTLRIKDEDEKRRAREQLAAVYLPAWAGFTEAQLRDGPFVGGDAVHVVDLKLHMVVRWFKSGSVDHVPATVFDPFPKLVRVHDAVRDHAGVKAWYAKG
ncbi:MAG: glutathione S-transferase family protein [Myxococcales bacterium]|nr:glutathione S-transferase family protein [Myxococcales bacterium]HQY63159.1 glutathione S-transferase family protein [Polyangiaceae bacterium]